MVTFHQCLTVTAWPPNNRLQRTIGADVFQCAPLAAEPECSADESEDLIGKRW